MTQLLHRRDRDNPVEELRAMITHYIAESETKQTEILEVSKTFEQYRDLMTEYLTTKINFNDMYPYYSGWLSLESLAESERDNDKLLEKKQEWEEDFAMKLQELHDAEFERRRTAGLPPPLSAKWNLYKRSLSQGNSKPSEQTQPPSSQKNKGGKRRTQRGRKTRKTKKSFHK